MNASHRMWQRRIGRLQVRLHVYRHRYDAMPDRWVFQPSIIWDRKPAGLERTP